MHNLINNSVHVKYSFNIKDEIKTYTQTFADLQSANAYLTASARDWFLGTLENYINHKKHIIEAAHLEKVNNLAICLNAYEYYQKWQMQTICAKFLVGFKYFENILPNPNNNSYNSSVEALQGLKIVAEAFKNS